MKKASLIFACLLIAVTSCQKGHLDSLKFVGELYAKNVVGVYFDSPENIEELEYRWYFSPAMDGDWNELQGIETDEIVLLTSYIGSYLKCEITYSLTKSDERFTASVISSSPVEYIGNTNADWFRDAGFGIMVHYLKPAIVPGGDATDWNDAVNSFNVERFASQANEAGVGFVMFTLGQNSGYYCSPNTAYDRALGISPGELCSNRDLPMDLMLELKKYNIPLILYLPANPPVSNKLVSEKFKYSFKKDSATSQYNQPILEDMIREWSLRYGDGVKAWWFDGLYSWNSIRSTRMDMSLKHNISTHTLAAKAGNKQSLVTYNYGFGEIQVNTPYCDYSSGEKRTIDEYPKGRWVEDGVQWFLFTYLGEKWGGKGHQFITDSLVTMADKIVRNDGVLCLEVVADAKGEILSQHLEQIKAVGKKIGKVK
jgi:Alpha-L-fucosidase